MTRILGIETSCDETAAAIVEGTTGRDLSAKIASNVVHSQIDDHAEFGGVVPEIAARAHIDKLDGVITRALNDANTKLEDIDAIAVTVGPGLGGGLIVGTMTARALAMAVGKPLIAVNHLEGHALTARLTDAIAFPYLLLLVSGGHTQIVSVEGLATYIRYATTIDDALGEAFDKTAKLLGLGYPGGPEVEKAALTGDPHRFALPRPMKGNAKPDFSFSGLKTAVRLTAEDNAPLTGQTIADLCASFQLAVSETVQDRVAKALARFSADHPDASRILVVAGGVAANKAIRMALEETCAVHGFKLIAAPLALCTDNAAMIAWAGLERFEARLLDDEIAIRTRWPLDAGAAPLVGSGRRGPKA